MRWRPNIDRRAGRDRLANLTHRTRQVLVLAGATGVVVGLIVAAFDLVTAEIVLAEVVDLPLPLQAAAPAVGLAVAVMSLRVLGRGASAATADEYIRAFHDPVRTLTWRPAPARLLAAVATLGLGGPLGYEGPSIYAGATLGATLQRRVARYFGPEDAKVLLVAGAAAGVAAIFKAPVTGLVFALEVPFQEDLARRMLLPAAISSAASYLVFAAIAGTEPLLPVAGEPPFSFVDLAGAAVIGVLCGLLARAFIDVVARAKRVAASGRAPIRVALAGVVLAATVVVAAALDDGALALGPGYDALRWALDPDRAVIAIVALGTIRVIGGAAVIAGGGVGGLFIPLVVQGALVGRAVGGIFEAETTTLFPVVGMAAFLGAGYRVPLAAVVFVAEFTGRAGFVVPGLIAAVIAQLVMGRRSLSPYQVAGRVGHLEERLRLPLAATMDADARTVPPDATAEELFWQHLVGNRQHSVVVVDGDTYLGLACIEDLARIERASWPAVAVRDVMRVDVPCATPRWPLRDAVRAMEAAGVDRLAVCDGDVYIGVVTAAGLVALDDLLDGRDGAL